MPTSLIIGGSSGIGLATAARLSTLGDIVHIAGRNVKSLSEATRQHPSLIPHELDAGDFDAVASLAAGVGVVDRLIVTVSGNKGVGPLADLDLERLRSAFDEKLWPTITALKAALPHLAHSASVTLVGAITARIGMPETAGIGSLNAAVEGLVAPLAAELAPVRVNAVSPGYVDTPWWSMLDDDALLFSNRSRTGCRPRESRPPTISRRSSNYSPPTRTSPAPSSSPTEEPASPDPAPPSDCHSFVSAARNIASVPCRWGQSCTCGPSPISSVPTSGRASSCRASGTSSRTEATSSVVSAGCGEHVE